MAGRAELADLVAEPGEGDRLGRSDWIIAGFQALVDRGPEAVRVEPLARALAATKGSFYWHFKGVADLHAAMLQAWEGLASTAIRDAMRLSDRPAREQLIVLAERVSVLPEVEVGGRALEPAIRDWGRVDQPARETLMRVDRRRLADLAAFLADAGLAPDAAADGAATFYGAMIGLESLRATAGVAMRPSLVAVAQAILAQSGVPPVAQGAAAPAHGAVAPVVQIQAAGVTGSGGTPDDPVMATPEPESPPPAPEPRLSSGAEAVPVAPAPSATATPPAPQRRAGPAWPSGLRMAAFGQAADACPPLQSAPRPAGVATPPPAATAKPPLDVLILR